MVAKLSFTNTALDALPIPAKGRAEYRDDQQPALILRVAATGDKSFAIVGWSRAKGNATRVSLGPFKRPGDQRPRVTVQQARKLAAIELARLAAGEDVNAARKAKRAASASLRDVLTSYLAGKRDLKERTRADYVKVLAELCPDWLDKPITSITRDALRERHGTHGKTRSKARANNAVRVIRALWNWQADGADIGPNPARSPKRQSFMFADRRKRTRIKDHELPAWWAAVTGLQGQRSNSGAALASDMLQFLLLTGLRLSEATSLRWEYVDTRAGTIEIPDPKNREPHVLPLSRRLFEIIKRQEAERVGPYVFPSKADRREPYAESTLRVWIKTIEADSGIRANPHDLRRTFASVAESLDISSITVKALLNHRTGRHDVTTGYVVANPERLRSAMQRIENEFIRLAETQQRGAP